MLTSYVSQLTGVGLTLQTGLYCGHPSVADGQVSRTVCFHWTAGCCEFSTNNQREKLWFDLLCVQS